MIAAKLNFSPRTMMSKAIFAVLIVAVAAAPKKAEYDGEPAYVNDENDYTFDVCNGLAGDESKLSGFSADVKACSAIDCFTWCTWMTSGQKKCEYDECDTMRQDYAVKAGVCSKLSADDCNKVAKDMKKGDADF